MLPKFLKVNELNYRQQKSLQWNLKKITFLAKTCTGQEKDCNNIVITPFWAFYFLFFSKKKRKNFEDVFYIVFRTIFTLLFFVLFIFLKFDTNVWCEEFKKNYIFCKNLHGGEKTTGKNCFFNNFDNFIFIFFIF